LSHYREIYRSLDPAEVTRRCALPFNPVASAFSLRLMGRDYRAAFPEFAIWECPPATVPKIRPEKSYEDILILRYLCEGKYLPGSGRQLSYNEIPGGNVYYQNFEGRCIKRFARTFGNDIEGFKNIMEENKALRAEPLDRGDAGYRFEFQSGLFMSLILWAGDDEFPPAAQMLFDDNFVFAFTAEDIAVVGELVIERLKELH
jgi:hypothetical protein